jgi:hypothetical protein
VDAEAAAAAGALMLAGFFAAGCVDDGGALSKSTVDVGECGTATAGSIAAAAAVAAPVTSPTTSSSSRFFGADDDDDDEGFLFLADILLGSIELEHF